MNKESWSQANFFEMVEPIRPPAYLPDATLEYFYLTQGEVALAIRDKFVPFTNEVDLTGLSQAWGWYVEYDWLFSEGNNVYVLNHTHDWQIARNIFTLRAIDDMRRKIKKVGYREIEGEEKYVAYYVDEEGIVDDLNWTLSDQVLKLKTYPYYSNVEIGLDLSTSSFAMMNELFWKGNDMDWVDKGVAQDDMTRYLFLKYAARVLSRFGRDS